VLLDDQLAMLATGRSQSLFTSDLAMHGQRLAAQIRDARTLVIGGAGSVGSATISSLLRFEPAAVHVVDQNENGLAELIRHLRSRPEGLSTRDFQTFPVDFGSPWMDRLLDEQRPYDYVLNFAAIKHVRSEKDSSSILQMLDTNVLKPARLLRSFAIRGCPRNYFCVSTDKAANPVNLMGASKRLMEHVVFSGEAAPDLRTCFTSARFANVAFSDGSLLHGFQQRLMRRQPLAVPRNTRRYFVSMEEAGQICLLAALAADHGHTLIPQLDPSTDLKELATVAQGFLECHKLEPCEYEDEQAARVSVAKELARGRYPMLLTPLDTSGEKPYEEFAAEGEVVAEAGFPHLRAIPYLPTSPGAVRHILQELERLAADTSIAITKADIVRLVATAVTNLQHIETGKTLDGRM